MMRIWTKVVWLFFGSFLMSFNVLATETEITLEMLKQQVDKLQQQIIALEKSQQAQQNHPAQQVQQNQLHSDVVAETDIATQDKRQPVTELADEVEARNKVSVYATMRPTYGYIDEKGEQFWDVRDALSHAGIKASNDFMPGWQAILHGEWGIDLSNNGDFGNARRAYVAVDSPYGRLGVGKQRPPQYLLIAEYVDIFNHANSPFSYDPEGIFFVNNMVTYRIETGGLSWLAAGQFDGDSGNNNADMVNLGVSYDVGGFHGAISYLQQDSISDNLSQGEDIVWAAALAHQFDMGLYLAAAYQDKTYKRDVVVSDRTGHTMDISGAYRLSQAFRLKLGYFDFDDGYQAQLSQKFNGYNTTLEWLPDEHLRFHLEYLVRDYDYLDDFNSWSVGFRYDFAKDWRF
ncbi:porin [Shewanella sp. Scap07]|uniref:porin n=1 Tax=Shewanella sp. Scap07 TaxID=2589987 RepID=UPI002117619F|nr:porin [Shewanella sp. Scap07]